MTDFWAEFLGTMILILLGDGVVAGVLLSRSKAQNAGWVAITTGWGLAVMAGVFAARAVGGDKVGYINPVGPVAELLMGTLDPQRFGPLVAGEFAGAFVGAVLVWLHYLQHWGETSDPGLKLAVFCTGPAIRSPVSNLLSEAIATFVLVFVGGAFILKVIGTGPAAPFGGALVWAIGLSLGGPTGYALNPARDLAPRLAHALLPIPGKGGSDWGYAWIPVVGPILGGVAGAMLAKAMIVPPETP